MSRLFADTSFDDPIGSWNTSAVTDMQYMFYYAMKFNQPIGSWDTSAVKDMQYMFYYAVKFNQPIGSWDTSAVKDMQYSGYQKESASRPITSCSLPRQSRALAGAKLSQFQCSMAWLLSHLCSCCVTPSEVAVTLMHEHWPIIGEDPFTNLTFLCILYCFAFFWDWLSRPRNSFKRTQKTLKTNRKKCKTRKPNKNIQFTMYRMALPARLVRNARHTKAKMRQRLSSAKFRAAKLRAWARGHQNPHPV